MNISFETLVLFSHTIFPELDRPSNEYFSHFPFNFIILNHFHQPPPSMHGRIEYHTYVQTKNLVSWWKWHIIDFLLIIPIIRTHTHSFSFWVFIHPRWCMEGGVFYVERLIYWQSQGMNAMVMREKRIKFSI